MMACIINAADRAAMITLLSGQGMTYVDQDAIEQFKAPPQCGFFELTAITHDEVADRSDPENPVITTPRLVKSDFWLMLHSNEHIAGIEAFTQLKYCCDTENGEHAAHCASVTTTAITGDPIIGFDGLPSGVGFDCF
ncbi:MAG: hypothetical protein COB24_08770 [Hyphomicrobiales bacterium]|nr:MAG: hypothetical protein COB24_08770 [Hyphomicrobiales bacterium]